MRSKTRTPRNKRGPAIQAKARRSSKALSAVVIRPIFPARHAQAGERIPRPGDKRIKFTKNGKHYLRDGNGTIMGVFPR